MQLSTAVLEFALLATVMGSYWGASASLTNDELLDEITETLLVRYLESGNLDQILGRLCNDTTTGPWAGNTGNFGNNVHTDGGDFGIGNGVQPIKSQGRYINKPMRRWWNGPSSSTSNSQWENNSGDFGNQVNTGGGNFGIGNGK